MYNDSGGRTGLRQLPWIRRRQSTISTIALWQRCPLRAVKCLTENFLFPALVKTPLGRLPRLSLEREPRRARLALGFSFGITPCFHALAGIVWNYDFFPQS